MIEQRVRDHLTQLLESGTPDELDAFTTRCVWAGIDADELQALTRELLATLPKSTRAWWAWIGASR